MEEVAAAARDGRVKSIICVVIICVASGRKRDVTIVTFVWEAKVVDVFCVREVFFCMPELPHRVCSCDFDNVHVWVEKTTTLGDVDASLNFISCKHPDSNAGPTQQLNRGRHAILQAIFNLGQNKNVD